MKAIYVYDGIETINEVASDGDIGCKTSLIARKSSAVSTTTESETVDVKVKNEADHETTGRPIPYSPKNPRQHGFSKTPWVNLISSNGKVTLVDIIHGDEMVGTMIVDKGDTDKIRYPVRLDQDGYAINRGSPPKPVAHSILGFNYDPEKDLVVDHINRIKLDNRRRNLRLLTIRGNNLNHPPHAGNSTGVRGLNRDVYIDRNGITRYQAYEAIIVNPHEPIDPGIGKAKQYRKKFYFGRNGLPESEARRSAESWLNQMSKKFERERLDLSVVGSTTIPGTGVGSSDPKKEATEVIQLVT